MRFIKVLAALAFTCLLCGCATLLIEREWLDEGFSADDYERTRSWAALEVAPKSARAWEEAGFAPSYKDSQTERTKPHRNMPNNMIFGYAPNVWTQNGFTPNELSEALKSRIPSSRIGAFKPSAVKELKKMRLTPKEWRYYLDSSSSETKNYDLNAVKRLKELGLSGESIDAWRTAKRENGGGFTQEEAIAWVSAGVKDPNEAIGAEQRGYSPKVWAAIKTSGVAEEDWNYCIGKGLSVADAKAWADAGVKCTRRTPKAYIDAKLSPSQVKPWAIAGFDSGSAIAFIKRGIGINEARSWLSAFNKDYISVAEIAEWKKASFSPSEAKKWRELTRSASVAKGYKNAGLTNNRIVRLLIANAVAPSAAASEYRKIYNACGLEFVSDNVFLTRAPESWGDINPYNALGKCIIPSGFSFNKTLQNGEAVYRIDDARRAKAGYEIDGYLVIVRAADAPKRLNNNAVLKAEEIGYQSVIGGVISARTVWAKR